MQNVAQKVDLALKPPGKQLPGTHLVRRSAATYAFRTHKGLSIHAISLDADPAFFHACSMHPFRYLTDGAFYFVLFVSKS